MLKYAVILLSIFALQLDRQKTIRKADGIVEVGETQVLEGEGDKL